MPLHEREYNILIYLEYLQLLNNASFSPFLFEFIFSGKSEWIPDLSGFVFGFLVCFMLAPGGLQRVIGLIRRD